MSRWTYGVLGLGDRDKKTMETHRRKGQAICYRMKGETCDVWQYSECRWVAMPVQTMDFVMLCTLIGERAPGNRSLASRTAGLARLPEAEDDELMLAPADAAYRLHRSPTRIYRWIQSGCPAYAVWVGGQRRIRVRLPEVRAWAREQGFL